MDKKIFLVVSVCLLFMAGCKPDLMVSDLDVIWDDTTKKAFAEISNIGNANAGAFMVYFNAEEDPVSPNHRPQIRLRLADLEKGASIELTVDFSSLAHPDNQQLGNVYRIKVMVDPKNEVVESNENNNSRLSPL